ncbi:MAG: GvpL/GvpF family gas vesicle protein [Nanoarchaeota archaeon]
MGEYLYCIIRMGETPKMDFEVRGIGNREIRCANYNDLTAVISETPLKEYKPTEEYTKEHKNVNLHILENHTLLPVAFGMVFKNKNILLNTMRRLYPVLKKSLRLVDNKIELGVKVVIHKELDVEKTFGKDKEKLRKECEADFAALDKIAVQAKAGKLFSERLVLNRSFLVDREKIDKFSAAVEKLRDKYKKLKIQYTGPWPPYNFVNIRIMGRGR